MRYTLASRVLHALERGCRDGAVHEEPPTPDAACAAALAGMSEPGFFYQLHVRSKF